MKIWEAILYGLFGGVSELLPISYSGHYALLRSAFNLTPLNDGGGYYVRLALCIGVILAINIAFRSEARTLGREVMILVGIKKRRRRDRYDRMRVRSIVIGLFALLPMLLSLIFASLADHFSGLIYVALLFILNGIILFFCFRTNEGGKSERSVLLSDMFWIGLGRAFWVLPGLSSTGISLSVGRMRGLNNAYNTRLTYMLTLAFECVAFFYHLIRALLYGSFAFAILLPMLFTVLFAAVAGYFAIQYYRYLMQQNKINFFAYYSWEAAVVVLILALINA
ncbi:MAG: undecaprenyl-diphosphate phosphatase [Oscillospiraceae bacterium]|nr:undecaprenyl-diphosphate phosphatase [Oscillospiraceae bacterium]